MVIRRSELIKILEDKGYTVEIAEFIKDAHFEVQIINRPVSSEAEFTELHNVIKKYKAVSVSYSLTFINRKVKK